MSSGLERFGITYLSPTAINLYIESPGLWALQYLAKIRDGGNAKMWRGSAVEAGLKHLLHGQPMSAAVAEANNVFSQELTKNLAPTFHNTEDVLDQRKLIVPMLEQARAWTAPGRPLGSQLKITCNIPDVLVPIIGYVDFSFESVDVDCKTSEKINNSVPADHARQVSIYRYARSGKPGALLYITHAKRNYLTVDDAMMKNAIDEVRSAALSMQNLLSRMDNREDVVRSLPINWDSWKAPKQRISTEQIVAHIKGEINAYPAAQRI